jgi:hypothetical protein
MSAAACVWMLSDSSSVSAVSPKPDQSARQGSAQAGRSVFNGKGICYYCHGADSHRDRVPQLEAETAALIASLDPQPADLRNAKRLRLNTDQARAKLIKEGHEGTGMFPDTRMTEQELADTLAYLSLLRREGRRDTERTLVPTP